MLYVDDWLTMLFRQRQQFDIYTAYCLKKMAAERCIDELGGDHNGFLQVCNVTVAVPNSYFCLLYTSPSPRDS